ncbi:MAG: c-type cytochrome [Myxococcales bacterium]|jgi:mono/diheme cytochrome c family protein
MESRVERLEVFIDDEPAPVRILLRPPFKFQLETRSLPKGRHVLRVVTLRADNRREERRIAFRTEDVPCIYFEGIAAPSRAGRARARSRGTRPELRRWPLIALVFVVGAALWAYARSGGPAPRPTSAPVEAAGWSALEGAAPGPAQPVEQRVGAFLASRCAGCHGPQAPRHPGRGPLLDSRLVPRTVEELTSVVERHFGGRLRWYEAPLSPQEASALLELLRQQASTTGGEGGAAPIR